MSDRTPKVRHAASGAAAVQSAGAGFNISARIEIKEDISHLPKLSHEKVVEIIKAHFAGQLGEEELNAIIRNPEIMEKLAPAAAILDSPALRESYDVRIDTTSGKEGAGIKISITRRIDFHDSTRDFSAPASEQKDVAYVSITVLNEYPAEQAKKKGKKKKKVEEAKGSGPVDEYAGAPKADFTRICRPGDRGCWQRQIDMFGSVPNLASCGEYIDEAEDHGRKIGGRVDPNLPKMSPLARALANPPPPVEPPMTDVDGARVFAATVVGSLAPGYVPPTISKPPNECTVEWGNEEAVPTLACTESVLQYERWSRDGLAKASDATFGIVGKLPIIATHVFLKYNKVSGSTAHNSIWAARWLDFMRVRLQGEDYKRIDEALKMLSRSERPILLAKIRQWYNEKDMADYRPLFTTLLQNYFIDLYPEAADENGLPAFEKMPTRLWWATNWLSTVKRNGMPLPAALNLLRCTASSDVAVATLKNLLPYLKSTGRFRIIALELETLLAVSPPS